MKRIITIVSEHRRDSQVTYVDGPVPRNVITPATLRHERKYARLGWPPHMCCMGDHGSRRSIAFSVWCLISDVHSPMDYSPVHARWEVIY